MKHIILSIISLTLSTFGLFALPPKIDYQTNYLEVTDIERQDTCLRISVILKNFPGYWINIPKNAVYLRSQNDTVRKYKLIGSENFELNKRIWMKESGKHEGILIFEKIPSDVTVVDMLSTEDNGNIETMGLGINLEETDTNEPPKMIDPKTLFETASLDEWSGLDPKRYKDIPFYQENGKAHVKGKLYDYHPAAGFSTLKIHTNNFITGSRDNLTENINTDGTFEFDLNVDYPQYCTLQIGDMPSNDVFVIPGDTVELVTTTHTDFLNEANGYRKYFGFTGRINDATAVNLLTDSLISRYNLNHISSQYNLAKTDSMPESVYNKNKELGVELKRILSDLPEFLGQINVSTYVKDLLATEALTSIVTIMQWNDVLLHQREMQKNLRDSENNYIKPFESLDSENLYQPYEKINLLVYSNPLTISTNRYLYSSLGQNILFKDRDSATNERNCFALQLLLVKSLIESMEIANLHDRESLNKHKENVTNLASIIAYPALNMALINTYTDLVEDVVLKENSIKMEPSYTKLDVDKEKDVLEELVKPYLGNLVYIDFWALWCSPCRMGMIEQKKIVEHFADQPFKVLYVSDDSNIAGSNHWLQKKNIPGEHIYLSSENWKRISEYFNSNYFPFGVLIGKDGNLIKTHFNLNYPNADKEIERHLKE
ncbi:MAG: TlpA family protein disulfide reductase [Muribaculaceae bacterium]|nr:TlpA family protein disulfide reductase [Muribaculaceae bacterium]